MISETYDMDVSILINKKDTRTYQLLFNYMGTYPNINIIFSTKGETKSIYDVIDIFNIIKNKASRDYIYFTLINKNTLNVVKAKRYSNLKDVLAELKIVTSNLVINNIKQNQKFFKNILIIFEKFCFYFVIKIRKNKFIYTFKKGAYYV